MKKALITGITGQDGSYLAEFLLSKGYEVHGIIRRSSSFNTKRINHIYQDPHEKKPKLILHYGDLSDFSSIINVLEKVKPDEIYNLAAQSHVKVSFETPEYTGNTDALGTLRMLEAIRILELTDKTKFYQASTSELYGGTSTKPYNEESSFNPRSPYGVAKLYGYWIVKNYREAYGIFACNGILFNHESERRGLTFVTRKVTTSLCRIKTGLLDTMFIGNMDAFRDWGYAKEYVEGMWLMLQHNTPEDFVIATGEAHSVREFIEVSCKELGMEIEWRGKGVEEEGIDKKTGKVIVKVDPAYFRPTEVEHLLGDSSKIQKVLGWKPKTTFKELVKIMIKHDLEAVKKYGNDVMRL